MIETPATLAREAARKRAFVLTEKIWPAGQSLFGSKVEAIEWFTIEILKADEIHQRLAAECGNQEASHG